MFLKTSSNVDDEEVEEKKKRDRMKGKSGDPKVWGTSRRRRYFFTMPKHFLFHPSTLLVGAASSSYIYRSWRYALIDIL